MNPLSPNGILMTQLYLKVLLITRNFPCGNNSVMGYMSLANHLQVLLIQFIGVI